MKNDLLIITALEAELNRDVLPAGVEIVYTGVGKINASIASYQAIHRLKPKHIINFGTAGKINPQIQGLLEIGAVIQRDMNAEPLAPRGKTPFSHTPTKYHSSSGFYICGTGDSFVNSHDEWLHQQKVDLVDMELFAIAAVAHHHGIPWKSFKYITDDANENSGSDWQGKVNHGQELYLAMLNKVLEQF
ncbi:5'-methylthioadenosine nucleosidase [Polynucleobacter sp. AP-Latsch-80-C2]|jgi:adenosylhomocysteine nucleosidase|uniref:phosphorylase family protein n=1 Tax=Polynucleobacter sp. AP-Latsch-80-C2 TaxID=2576931 RepID=UPI001C0CCA29|nr:5'-methylthioadenosine nucleosidase [Polynucleobacter sp. AP-Latsch-80-C2]MBU3624049.1 5'-methylthioadenosine nucleosidase [Polynucleobacter sp. AP-Latsch-80-C2]